MEIHADAFLAYLKCPTKCWLLSLGESGEGNAYAEWIQRKSESYWSNGIKRLLKGRPKNECVVFSPTVEILKTTNWRLGLGIPIDNVSHKHDRRRKSVPTMQLHEKRGLPESDPSSKMTRPVLTTHLHAVQNLPSKGQDKLKQLIPIRFIFNNKLKKNDKLLLAFDALVLSQVVKNKVSSGKIIFGDDYASRKIKTTALLNEVRENIQKLTALLSNHSPPDLVLNRHCIECKFQLQCRKKALEADDLSLLANMTEKERAKHHNKGIFTVTQLSYTFRPRRRAKRLKDKCEKYHHSLKALAIREKKIHIVSPQTLRIDGTPVYLDVEGLPHRDFYYLIGIRFNVGESIVQQSLWADGPHQEKDIWSQFLGVIEVVQNPVLIH